MFRNSLYIKESLQISRMKLLLFVILLTGVIYTMAEQFCCQALISTCEACKQGITAEEWCDKNPGKYDCPCPVECWNTESKECFACIEGLSEEEWCKVHPGEFDCPARICCEAMTPACLACKDGLTVEQYCENNPHIEGCERVIITPTPSLLQKTVDTAAVVVIITIISCTMFGAILVMCMVT